MQKMQTEVIAARWVTPEKAESSPYQNILWAGVARDTTLLAQVGNDDPKVLKAVQRFLQKEPKPGWEFRSYVIESQKRIVQAAKFHVYERIPFLVGDRIKLSGLENESFLNGTSVRILDYYPDIDHYLIRPTVPLSDEQKLSSTGKLTCHSRFLVPRATDYRVWTFLCVYDGNRMKQRASCRFIQKVALVAEGFRVADETTWKAGGELSCMPQFGPIFQAILEDYEKDPFINEDNMDDSLEFCKQVISNNMELLRRGAC